MDDLPMFIWEEIDEIPQHKRLMAQGLWMEFLIFKGPLTLRMSKDHVSSMRFIFLDLDVFNISPLLAVTWKLSSGNACFVLGFECIYWYLMDTNS